MSRFMHHVLPLNAFYASLKKIVEHISLIIQWIYISDPFPRQISAF